MQTKRITDCILKKLFYESMYVLMRVGEVGGGGGGGGGRLSSELM